MAEEKEPTLLVTEMFESVQGESTWAGLPCFFIRLTGCPLRCRWCDTEYAFAGGTTIPIREIVEKAEKSGIDLVEVTGGEPLAQPNCPLLCERLLEAGKTVLVETAGSHPIEVLPERVFRIVDLKCPDSGECNRNLWSNLDELNQRDEVKFVIAGRVDYEWARAVVGEHDLDRRVRSVLFAPVHGELEPRKLVSWILEDRLPVRFQLQIHKIVWEPERTGV
jgi:7-carboxy-7-deazaguanine synthase